MKNFQQIVSLAIFAIVVSSSVAMSLQLTKIFNYQGAMPIKDAIGLEATKVETNSSNLSQEQKEAEAACWKVVNKESYVTFDRQEKVLDELKADLGKIKIDAPLKAAVERIADSMRENMKSALDGLKRDRADEYFDSLFEASEDIIHLSVILRNREIEDEVFLVLVKAVARLSRNNSNLIESFAELCSLAQRSPKPRVFTAVRGFW